MNFANFFNFIGKPYRITCVLMCLLGFHAAEAKSEAPKANQSIKRPDLVLDLQADNLLLDSNMTGNNLVINTNIDNATDNQQLIVANKKKQPLNLGCGMDVYQNTGPDISISSRLTGECDLKYHY
ncbi:hypothetical protein [Methylomonas sp. AM2-LC]|uniref:hypothetical protein n=1 Tax=Methylomonas sp. AM2-LC TaxID=3153301 RepID=UPI003266F7D7